MLHSCVSSQNCCVACTTSLTNFSHQSLTSIHKHIIYSPLSLLLLVMIPSSLAICLANWHIHFYLNTDLSCVSRINPLYPGSILWVPNQSFVSQINPPCSGSIFEDICPCRCLTPPWIIPLSSSSTAGLANFLMFPNASLIRIWPKYTVYSL